MKRYGKWAAVLGTAAAMLAGSVGAQEAVSLRLNWYLGGLHVPFDYGKDLGYYKAEGIDLAINEGRGSGNTVQVVAAGSDTFGMADSGSLALAATKGAEVRAVMSLLNTAGFGVISRADAGIRTPKPIAALAEDMPELGELPRGELAGNTSVGFPGGLPRHRSLHLDQRVDRVALNGA